MLKLIVPATLFFTLPVCVLSAEITLQWPTDNALMFMLTCFGKNVSSVSDLVVGRSSVQSYYNKGVDPFTILFFQTLTRNA